MLSEEKSRQIEMAGTDRACMMLVCINGNENNVPYGIIVNYHLPRPVSFKGIHGLILALDEVCEMVGVPMQPQNHVSCKRKGRSSIGRLGGKRKISPIKSWSKRMWQGRCSPM